MEDMSLPTLFKQARKITLLATDSTLDKETLRKGCEALQKCEEMISKLGLFSTNETKDEISTTNLKYILAPFYLAELIEKTGPDDDDDRIQILKASQAKLKEFLSFCDAMELLPEDESLQERQNTAVDRRAKKIARFKRQLAAESKLLELKERKERRGRSTRAAALFTPVDAGDHDVLDDDGEEERETGPDDDDDRIQILKASQAKLKEFLSFCDAMELLPEDESLQERQNTAVDRRAKKIARFKRQLAAESKLLELKERKERRGRSTRAAALFTPVDAGDHDVLDDDGEEERELEGFLKLSKAKETEGTNIHTALGRVVEKEIYWASHKRK
ncbi:putative TAP46-like protein [Helianthus debilis subsp. tardiflorus]